MHSLTGAQWEHFRTLFPTVLQGTRGEGNIARGKSWRNRPRQMEQRYGWGLETVKIKVLDAQQEPVVYKLTTLFPTL